MKAETWDHRYDDILYLPHPVSQVHPAMPLQERAAQFASFKALTGFEDEIDEQGRFTEAAAELDESRRDELDARLNLLLSWGDASPEVEFTWFCPDDKKAGGKYCSAQGRLIRIDPISHMIFLSSGDHIPVGCLFDIRGAVFAEP